MPLAEALPESLRNRSTLLGFLAVMLLCVALVAGLLVQVDIWSRAGFEQVKNNAQQARQVLVMRSAVQERELVIQRMVNMDDPFERDDESKSFYRLANVYVVARQKLMKTDPNDALLENIKHLDEAVFLAYPYHNDLVEALVYGDHSKAELEQIVRQGSDAREKVLSLLDRIIETQEQSYETVIADYDRSRIYTLLGVGLVFVLIAFVIVYAVRTSARQFRHVSRLSIVDEVTGTYNRRYFEMVLSEEWKRSMREYTPLSLIMLDIDFFKAYNDKFGHQMGDDCLFSMGKILSGQLQRTTDFTARYGGEEFVIVLPNTSLEHARMLGERLRRAVEEARIRAGDDSVSPWVTVSVGVATATVEFDQQSSALVQAADKCLYRSKHDGRNRVTDTTLEVIN